MRFEEILVIGTAIPALICIADYCYLRFRRPAGAPQGFMIEYSWSFLPVLLLVLLLRSFVAEPFRIPSGSMKPTLLVGDFILVNKFTYGLKLPITGTKLVSWNQPKRGEVIVFRNGPRDMIKRIVGLPGDKVEYKLKKLYVNGEEIQTDFVSLTRDDGIPTMEFSEQLGEHLHATYQYPHRILDYKYTDFTVPEGQYFVMGDNRDNSEDGRSWGFLKESDILGKAFLVWFSWDSKYSDPRWERLGMSIYSPTKKG